jgi:glutamate carboxypeptidase
MAGAVVLAGLLLGGAVEAAERPSRARLSAIEARIVAEVARGLPETIALLQETVDIPSATENLQGVRRVGEVYRRELDRLGFRSRWVEMPKEMKRAGHLFAERDGARGRRLFLIGHLDTVLEGRRFEKTGTRATGTGTVDMKGGNAIVIAALRALHAAGALDGTRLVIAFTGDEEDPGEPVEVARRDLIEEGKKSQAALAFEAAVGNTATVARRGVSTWTLEVTGVTAHSSGIFDESVGSGAIFEAGRILRDMHVELRGQPYLTFNPSLVVGGTTVEHEAGSETGSASGKTNVIAPRAVVEGDLRFLSLEQREAVKRAMTEIASRSLPRTSARITFEDSYPPMAPTPGNLELLKVLDGASRDLGHGEVPALDPGRRGAGDVSFVAPHVSGLDGLGAHGEGSHTPDEVMDLATLPALVERTALLIHRLTR